MKNLEVNCYSGHTYAERPNSFVWEGALHRVQEVEKEWQEPGKKHFRVRTNDNKRFELCYNESKDEWLLLELD